MNYKIESGLKIKKDYIYDLDLKFWPPVSRFIHVKNTIIYSHVLIIIGN